MLRFFVRWGVVKFKYSENATKIWNNIPQFFFLILWPSHNICTLLFLKCSLQIKLLRFSITSGVVHSKKIRNVVNRINSDLSEIKDTVGYRCCTTWNHSLFFEKPFIFLGVFYHVRLSPIFSGLNVLMAY